MTLQLRREGCWYCFERKQMLERGDTRILLATGSGEIAELELGIE